MIYSEEKVLKIINNVVVDSMNQEPHIFGRVKDQITIDQLSGKERWKEQVVARHIAQYMCDFAFNDLLGARLTLGKIGSFYNKDHSTVVYAKKTIKDYLDTSKQIIYMVGHCMDVITRRVKEKEALPECHRWYTYLYPKSSIL